MNYVRTCLGEMSPYVKCQICGISQDLLAERSGELCKKFPATLSDMGIGFWEGIVSGVAIDAGTNDGLTIGS